MVQIIEAAPEGGFWAICPEVPGANGQGETIEETKTSLRQAIELIDHEIGDIISEQYEKAFEILKGKKGILVKGAELLLEKEKIEGRELKALMEKS